MRRGIRIAVVVIATGTLVALPAVASNGPAGVSPGAPDRSPLVRDGCPGFSWELAPGTEHYDVVVYRFAADIGAGTESDLENAAEVLYARVPGGATGWTPALDECLAPGGRFVWFVRAVFDSETGEASDWSEAMLFSVAAALSAQEVERALDVLHLYIESGGDTAVLEQRTAQRSTGRRAAADRPRSGEPKLASRSVLTGTAAIRGEQPDAAGETYGVVGASASPDGAGLGAANTAGGPDLVLDGSADGVADAELSESGIDRPSPSPQTFTVNNTGGGGIVLEVDGVEVVTTATDADTLAGLTCAGDEIAKWNGATWVCAPDVDTDTLGSLMCGSGEVAKWTGSAWACAPDVDTDTDTLAFLGSRCLSGEIPRWDGSRWICDEDNDALGALNCGFPGRIAKWSGSAWACAKDQDTTYSPGPGLILDGNQILLDPTAFSKRISTLDSGGDVGRHTSIAIGADGLGIISYSDTTNRDLKVAHCDNVLCTSATLATLDGGGDVGWHTSIAIGADGLGIISYHDDTNYDLKVAHCDNVLCTSATLATLDSGGDVGRYTSIAIGADSLGIISYCDDTNRDLKVAHCDNVLCTSATRATLDSGGDVGTYTSIAIGADGLGIISYHDDTNDDLKVAHCDNVLCTSSSLATADSAGNVGLSNSLAIGDDGLGLISYSNSSNGNLKVAHCDNLLCTSATLSFGDSAPGGGSYSSLAIGGDGLGIISHHDSDNRDLKVVHLPFGL